MAHRHSVLIVEDDAAIRDVYGELLRADGHSVSEAGDGVEALRLLNDGAHPCILIFDLLLPNLDGWGLAQRVAETPRLAQIPLVVLSAQPSSGSGRTPPNARARLTKPVSLDELLSTVDEYCLVRARAEGRRRATQGQQSG